MLKRIWDSPTIMTWLSYSTKVLTLFGVMPLVLREFSPGDIVLWYLFSTIIALQSIADFGFRQTFSRLISYAYNGAEDIGIFYGNTTKSITGETTPNNNLLTGIISIMRFLYLRLTIILFILMALAGTWSLIKPLHGASNISEAWGSWVIVLFASCINFYGKIYLNFLEGLYKIALVRRIEAITSIASIGSSIFVLLISPSLLNLILVNQFWIVVVTIRDWYLCRTIENSYYKSISKKIPFDRKLFTKIWQPAWRSGVSGLMSVGLTNLTGLVYAQVGTTTEVASYLLGLRIINQIKEVSMAPFYSKIPLLAMLRVKNDISSLVQVIKRGMFLSHMVFLIGFMMVGIFSNPLLKLINSQVQFVSQPMWMLLGLAFFVHRFGAMHIQVSMSTNHIISHKADGISGLLYIVSAIFLSRYIGEYSIPIGMLIGYLGFYSWFAAGHSYRSLKVSFWDFEKSTSLNVILIMTIYIIIYFLNYNSL